MEPTTAPATPQAPTVPHDVAVHVVDLVKTYPDPEGGTLRAVDGLSFSVRRGEVFAMLGPNGAGKTTTLEIVEGLTRADSGTVHVLGIDPTTRPGELKERIGVQLQSSAYFEYLRLGELLELFGSFYNRRVDAATLLGMVGLWDKRRALVKELSGGQAQRFSIVAALVNDPEVVFLDEPSTGLDPQARRNVWELIRTINATGRTVVLTTHYMEEAEQLADRVGIIDHGKMVMLDTPAALISSLQGGHRIRFSATDTLDADRLARLPEIGEVAVRGNGIPVYELTVAEPDAAVPAVYSWARAAGVGVSDLQIRTATLEDVFLHLTGSTLRD